MDDLGTGVAEMLMLLFALHYWQRSGMAMTVLLEEPEAHLHPAAAAEFMRLVVKHLPRHQLLVTTHSTALVDAADSDWRMFRLDLSSGRTRVAPLSHSSDRRGLLADLGIRPSQLFLANAIVWVEGPSDCVYLRRLLSETCGADSLPPLVEGRDYAFAIYGGSAGVAHMSLGEDTERLVSLFFLSPNPIVICDRDVAFGEQLKVHVRRLLAEGQSLPGGPPVVVTHGREIENLVRPEILLDAVRACAPKSLGGKALRYPSVAIHDGDAFDVVVAGTARFEPDERLSAKERRVLAGRISANKGNIATHVVLASAPFNAGGTAFAREIIELIKRGRPL
ncbi:MAG: AAA family ATPase [Myxococcota bacterium]